jgi:hypothetical protein
VNKNGTRMSADLADVRGSCVARRALPYRVAAKRFCLAVIPTIVLIKRFDKQCDGLAGGAVV